MEEINILGLSSHTMLIIFDLSYEVWGIRKFRIFKNLALDEIIKLDINTDFYQHSIEEKDSNNLLAENSKLVFGVTGPFAKTTVFNHFKKRFNIHQAIFSNCIHPQTYIAQSVKLAQGICIV